MVSSWTRSTRLSRLRSSLLPLVLLAAGGASGVSYAVLAPPAGPPVDSASGGPASGLSGHANQVALPIEVLGAAGHVETVTLTVSDPSRVDSMYLVGHALGYHTSSRVWSGQLARDAKASYRVNGGAWRPISNDNARVRWPERAYLGIGGAYNTVRLAVPVTGVVAGANRIQFRFNGTEGIGSGYRILELDLLGPGGQSRVSGTQFVESDPETWRAPPGVSASAGEALWNKRRSLRESSLPGAETIVAACADCHATSGYDLKYFNYSNKSIRARARFHGLTETQAQQIAAYIRSLDLERTDGRRTSPLARPWNPPYQPGPGLTDRGEEDWAAGAGLEWVLQRDDETAEWLFPDAAGHLPNAAPTDADLGRALQVGTWDAAKATRADAFGQRLDLQNTPVAIQYPDWNHWLPDVHPLDAFGASEFMASGVWTAAEKLYTAYDSPSKVAETVAFDRSYLTCTTGCGRSGFDDLLNGIDYEFDNFPGQGGYDISYDQDRARYYLGKLSLMQWEAVKSWEVFNRDRLQDLGTELYGGLVTPKGWDFERTPLRVSGSRPGEQAPFFWPGGQSVVFDLAPHKHGEPGFAGEGAYGPPGSEVMQYYYSTAWYDLQLLLSRELTGNAGAGSPVDWNYQTSLALDLQGQSGVSQWWRTFRARHTAVQTRNNLWGQKGQLSDNEAFTDTNANWWEILGRYALDDGSGWTGEKTAAPALARRAVEQALVAWFSFASSAPVSAWARHAGLEGSGYQDASTVPTAFSRTPRFDSFTDADNVYRLPPLMIAWGMKRSSVDLVARWGARMWPKARWSQWYTIGSGPTAASQSIELAPGWNLVSAHVAPADSSLASVLAQVRDRVVLVRDPQGGVYAPDAGVNTISAWRRGEAYQIYASGPATLTLSGEPVLPSETPLALPQGWSQIAYLRRSPLAVEAALATVAPHLVLIKSGTGAVYAPGVGVDQIGDVRPGEGYLVYLSEPSTLLYPADGDADEPPAPPAPAAHAGPSATVIVTGAHAYNGRRLVARTESGGAVGEGVVADGLAVLTLRASDPELGRAPGGAADGDAVHLEVVAGDGGAVTLPPGTLTDLLTGQPVEGALRFETNGAWSAALSVSTASDGPPRPLAVGRPYPNPFQATATIPYTLSRAARVDIRVFDALGREVSVLVREEQGAGPHTATFDGGGFPGGVYWCRIQIDGEESVTSLSLVR